MLLHFIHWNVDPVMFHIGSFGLRYYSLGFVFAFVIGYVVMSRIFKREKIANGLLDNLVLWIFVSMLVGARLGHCLFYEPDYFCTADHWLEIILPINIQTGQFTGYQGLASHGAAIAIIIAMVLYCRKYNLRLLWLLDRLVIVVALGGAFVRLGNLFNSEIYGVATTLPWGFLFEQNGETVAKHPTQLYESLSYFIIFGATYAVYCKKQGRLHNGRLFGWWLVALWGVRFLVEFIKEDQVGFEDGMTLNMGQWLSVPLILLGAALVIASHRGLLKEGTYIKQTKNK